MKKTKTVATTFASYILEESIGEGGSGVVFKAKDDSGNMVAVKILDRKKASSEKLKRFKNEYIFCSKNIHPNIITVSDHGLTDEQESFIVMPLYEQSLRKIIGKLLPQESLSVFIKILDGIEAAHICGTIHRDLKPENILVNSNGKELVIADFGIADFEQDEIYTIVETKEGTRLANFQYAAPEQKMRGKIVDKKCDIYALGLILNELFTLEIAHGTDYKTIKLVDANYSYLDIVVEKMLRQDPASRYASIEELKYDLIARTNEHISLQKLNDLKTTVISKNDVDDPLISDPMRIVGVDWDNGILTIELNHKPNPTWIWSLQNMGSYSSVWNKGPEVFQFSNKRAQVSSDKNDAQALIDYFKGWLPMANNRYESKVKQDLELAEQKLRESLKNRIKSEEEKAHLKSSLRF